MGKPIGNVAPVRGIPGRSKDRYQCRHCSTETETLTHVLGSCPHGSLLRNTRHHTIRSMIAKELQKVGMETREEIHCIRNNGSTARVDILAWNAVSKKGYILDPTVRLQTSTEQPTEVDNEKKSIYEPTISYFKDKFHLKEIKVYGLLIGSRVTIPRLVANFLRQLGPVM